MLYPSAMALFQPILEDQPHRQRGEKGGRERLPGSSSTDGMGCCEASIFRDIYI